MTAERQLAALTNEHTVEWLCEPCKVIHPTQQKGKFLQPCPDCGVGMMPTSFNLRQLAAETKRANQNERDLHGATKIIADTTRQLAELREKHERLVARLREPSAWMNPENGVVVSAQQKMQIGEGSGYPKFSVPLYAMSTVALRDSEGGE